MRVRVVVVWVSMWFLEGISEGCCVVGASFEGGSVQGAVVVEPGRAADAKSNPKASVVVESE